VIDDHDNLFVMSEAVHFAGIGALAWKLLRRRAAGGLSLRTQELTAAFLAVRLLCSFVMVREAENASETDQPTDQPTNHSLITDRCPK
jgi:hypothetical protein